jgi:hypothetical protein
MKLSKSIESVVTGLCVVPAVAAVVSVACLDTKELARELVAGDTECAEAVQDCGFDCVLAEAQDIFSGKLEGRMDEFCVDGRSEWPEVCEARVSAYANHWSEEGIWEELARDFEHCGFFSCDYGDTVSFYLREGGITKDWGAEAELAACLQDNINSYWQVAEDLADCVDMGMIENHDYPSLEDLEE